MNNDLFNSPADPAFYFHHAQVDRVWTLWQGRDLERRGEELMGTTTWFNSMFFFSSHYSLFLRFFLSLFSLCSRSFASFFFWPSIDEFWGRGRGLILPNHIAPPSANITLSEPMDMGYLEETREVRYVMSTIDNGFCYIYE